MTTTRRDDLRASLIELGMNLGMGEPLTLEAMRVYIWLLAKTADDGHPADALHAAELGMTTEQIKDAITELVRAEYLRKPRKPRKPKAAKTLRIYDFERERAKREEKDKAPA